MKTYKLVDNFAGIEYEFLSLKEANRRLAILRQDIKAYFKGLDVGSKRASEEALRLAYIEA